MAVDEPILRSEEGSGRGRTAVYPDLPCTDVQTVGEQFGSMAGFAISLLKPGVIDIDSTDVSGLQRFFDQCVGIGPFFEVKRFFFFIHFRISTQHNCRLIDIYLRNFQQFFVNERHQVKRLDTNARKQHFQ